MAVPEQEPSVQKWDAFHGPHHAPLLRLLVSTPFHLFSVYVALASEIGAEKSLNLSSVPESGGAIGLWAPSHSPAPWPPLLMQASALRTKVLGLVSNAV